MVNKLKGATKANIWQERINEKCSIIIKLSKNLTNRVNQLALNYPTANLKGLGEIFLNFTNRAAAR